MPITLHRVASAHPAMPAWMPLLLGLLGIAAALAAAATGARLLGLADAIVWHDEVATLVRVFGHSYGEIWETVFSGRLLTPDILLGVQGPDPALGWDATLAALTSHPEHAPLYYLLARLAAELTGLEPVAAARGVSAGAGVLLVPATFWLARGLFGRGPVPWVAALLVACSPMHLLYAQDARQYALWTLLVVASSAALLRALGRDGDGSAWTRSWTLYGVLAALGLYTHLLFVLTLAVHGAYVLIAGGPRPWPTRARAWALPVAAAGLAFAPWLVVLVAGHEQTAHYTAWMERPIGWVRCLAAWSDHLTRIFVDLDPGELGRWGLLVVPLALAAAIYLWRAPRPALWLPVGLALVYLGVVLGPDLLLGGSRSQHVRYALPAVLAVQLVVAWTLGAGLAAPSPAVRRLSGVILAGLVLLGALSVAAAVRADTWWSKQFSAANGEVAELLNRAERPLVLASDSGVSLGELISLAHRLDGHVRIWGEGGRALPPLADFNEIVALMPSPGLRERLGPAYRFTPLADSWQWMRVESAVGPGASPSDTALGGP